MSKTKVVYTGEKFFVNKEKKTVACAINFEINLLEIKAVQIMFDDPQFHDFINNRYDIEKNLGVCKFKVSGKSKATDEDEFDETFGKRLAKTRAQEKAFIVANELYWDIREFVDKLVLRDFDNLIDGTEQAYFKCIDHEVVLTNEKFNLND